MIVANPLLDLEAASTPTTGTSTHSDPNAAALKVAKAKLAKDQKALKAAKKQLKKPRATRRSS